MGRPNHKSRRADLARVKMMRRVWPRETQRQGPPFPCWLEVARSSQGVITSLDPSWTCEYACLTMGSLWRREVYVCMCVDPIFQPSRVSTSCWVQSILHLHSFVMTIPPITYAFIAALAFSGLNASVGYLTNILDIPVAQVILIRNVSWRILIINVF